jgi:poly-gamma-glutamate synthesis protein (capsule biosynthesis protein)
MPSRRQFVDCLASGALGLGVPDCLSGSGCAAEPGQDATQPASTPERASEEAKQVRLFLCGDVMTGRGIDQILRHPSDPQLYESYMKSAAGYVELAERVNGPIPRKVGDSYIWGDALDALEQFRPRLRIVNLETSITTSGQHLPKGINYRMHPANVGCLKAARIDCCVLANNHVLDWGYEGLRQTLDVLHKADIRTAGAGRNLHEAIAPACFPAGDGGRVLLFAIGCASSGVPADWAASSRKPGIAFHDDLPLAAKALLNLIGEVRRAGDIVVLSVHWGGNWGYSIPASHQQFAHLLVDEGAVDIVHGHSSHHPLAMEVYRDKLILYGCGDFLNDYEGIGGYEQYRSHLVLMYLATVDTATKALRRLDLRVFETHRFRLRQASLAGTQWLRLALNREGARFGTRLDAVSTNGLVLNLR